MAITEPDYPLAEPKPKETKKTNILLLNLHGLIRGDSPEIGKDLDNGGQIVYALEHAYTLSENPRVQKVILFTRLIDDPALHPDYKVIREEVNPNFIIYRIPFGGRKYRLKEQLWEHLDSFVANAVHLIRKEQMDIDWIHGHYADAGYAAAELSRYLNIPYSFAGHSLGEAKKRRMLESNMRLEDIENRYNMTKRIAAEELAIANAEFVITSTQMEVDMWHWYQNRNLVEYHILPPGFAIKKFYPYQDILVNPHGLPIEDRLAMSRIKEQIDRFLHHPAKPFILVVCRPAKTKNIEGVLEAYGNDPELQAVANLVIFAGIRDDIATMADSEKEVLTQILLSMDRYNLYGKLAIPKKHDNNTDIPAVYRYCAMQKGVFMNAAHMENFGLTLLEAAACGLPVVATKNGGPGEIVANCNNGLICDPMDTKGLAVKARKLLVNPDFWRECSENGLININKLYTWKSHCDRFLNLIDDNLLGSSGLGVKKAHNSHKVFSRLKKFQKMLVTDIDGTLFNHSSDVETRGIAELRDLLNQPERDFVFAIASGRNLSLVHEILKKNEFPMPDIAVTSVGSTIFYNGERALLDNGWQEFINYRWNREDIKNSLSVLHGLRLQHDDAQNPYKLSYFIEGSPFDSEQLRDVLGNDMQNINVIQSHNSFLDILPRRAAKGKAIRYLAHKWNISLRKVMVAGDSGNDLDMFTGATLGIVVQGNDQAMENLRGLRNTYFAESGPGEALLEGMKHYGWL
jgi:sucrose-phosphate synthase